MANVAYGDGDMDVARKAGAPKPAQAVPLNVARKGGSGRLSVKSTRKRK